MNTAQRIAKNTFALLGSEVVIRTLTFVIILLIARRLGAESFGQYSFALAFVALFMMIGDMGIGTLTTRNVARDKHLVGKYMDNLFLVKALLSLFGLALIVLTVQLTRKTPEVKLLVYAAMGGLFTDALNLLVRSVFSAFEAMEYVAVVKILEKVCYFALCAVILLSDLFRGKLLLLVVAYPASGALALACGLYIVRKKIARISLEIDWPFWKSILKEGWPFAATGVFTGVYLYLDKVLLSVMKGDEVVGWYNAASKLFFTIYAIQSFYYQALFPVASRLYRESLSSLKRLLERSARLILACTIPIMVGGIVLAPSIIRLVYGAHYSHATLAFQILLTSLVVRAMHGIYGRMILLAADRQRVFMSGVGAGAVASLLLNIVLIPRYSLAGAATATVASGAGAALFLYLAARRTVRVEIKRHMLIPFVSSSLMACVLLLPVRIHVGGSVILGAMSYLLFMLLLRGIAVKDIVFVFQTLAPRTSRSALLSEEG